MDLLDFVRYIGALLLVLGLVGGAGFAARKFGLGSFVKPAATRRLAIVETLGIAPRQRLLIVRRDNIEHLILSGPDGTSVIESNIPVQPMPITASLVTAEAAE